MQQNTLFIISLLLALLPLISFYLQKLFCAWEHKIRLFECYPMVFYVDWIFILFNFFWIFCIKFNLFLWAAIFFFILAGNIFFYFIWARVHIRENNPIDLYDIKKEKITSAGIIHLIYAQVQACLILIFILSSVKNNFVYLELLLLVIYFIGYLRASRIIHKKVIVADGVLISLGFLVILTKLVWTIFI